ncbi:wax ester/triacylglycerol synthase family O-acyltransferase [Mycobacterium sp. B14F4]|uniref:WS/DGAT/MGAT family O-acyltransferase n=1 Tax=Mycobacterium sp. B14F4 TaxID=3153565 RepID=UPI00325F5161
MERLTTLDAGFLHAEDADRHVSLAIGGLAVLAGPAPDHESLMSTFAVRVNRCPRLGQRLRIHPFDLSAPQWIPHGDFDLAHHVRRIALPQPGDDGALHRTVADLMAMRLDRDRPLWEVWVIEGLTDDRWAMLTKVHHCMADGIAATHMLTGLCDDAADDSSADRVRAANPTDPPKPEGPDWTLNPLKLANALWHTSTSVATAAVRVAQGAAEIAVDLARPAAASTLNGPVSNLRRYSAARVPMRDVVSVCERFDVTVNDVALAAITEGYRAMLIRRGEQPLPDSLRTLVPVSMRSADAVHATDNRVSMLLPQLPVGEEHPLRRLEAVHSRVGRTRSHGQHRAGNAFVTAANRIPFPVTAWAVRLLARVPQRGVMTLATNVPGPRRRLTVMGREMLSLFPIPPIAMNMRTGVAMLSYADGLFFGILADYDTVPDVDALARGIELAVARLAACSRHRRGCAHRGLILVETA